MNLEIHAQLAAFIWDMLRGSYKRNEYGPPRPLPEIEIEADIKRLGQELPALISEVTS